MTEPPTTQPRKRANWSLRAVVVVVLGVGAWLLLGSALGVVRTLVALVGYLLVAVLAYWIGKWVGRHSAPPR